MAIGDNPFDISSQLLFTFNDQAVQVQLTPSKADENVPRDKFGKPLQPATSIQISIVVSKATEDIKPTAGGGKPVEVLEFYAMSGTVSENDEIVWNNHVFRTSSVWPFGMGGITQLSFCKAEREIDM